jgi:hypothetical protein
MWRKCHSPFAHSANAQVIDLALEIRSVLNAPQRGLTLVAVASHLADIDVFNTQTSLWALGDD